MAIKYITLMDGRVVPYDDTQGIPAGAMPPGGSNIFNTPEFITQYDADMSLPARPGNVDPSTTRRDKPMYGAPAYLNNMFSSEIQKYPNDLVATPVMKVLKEINRGANNIFGEYNPGGAGQIGGGNRRVGDREAQVITLPNGTKRTVFVNRDTTQDYFPDTSFADRAMTQANYTDPTAPNYVKPPTNLLNIDFGGTGPLGMSGEGAFTRPIDQAITSDTARFYRDLNNLNTAGLASEGIQVAPEVDAHLKLLGVNRGSGLQFMYKDKNPDYTRDTYLLPYEMANKLGISMQGISNESELISSIDKTLSGQNNSQFSKENFKMGGGPQTDTIDVSEVGGLFAKNIEDKARARKELDEAKARQGETLFDKVSNIFDDPYDDYVDEKGRTIRGDFLRREDESLLKKNNLDEVVEDTGPGFTKDQAMNLLGMYLTMGSLMTDEPPKGNITMGSYSVSPGLKLDVPNLYDRKRRT